MGSEGLHPPMSPPRSSQTWACDKEKDFPLHFCVIVTAGRVFSIVSVISGFLSKKSIINNSFVTFVAFPIKFKSSPAKPFSLLVRTNRACGGYLSVPSTTISMRGSLMCWIS